MAMRSLRRVLLRLVLLVGLAVPGVHFDDGAAAPPLALPGGRGGDEGRSTEIVAAPPPGELLARPPRFRSEPTNAVSEITDADKGSVLQFYDNGTIQLVDTLSQSPLWQFSTGPPLLKHITTASPGLSYVIYPVDESGLVEVYNGTGVKLPWKLEEFITRTPYIRDSVVTIGSKASTIFAVDADSGEIIYKHSLPATLHELGRPLVEETPSKLHAGRSGSSGNIIVVVRTDYSLSASELGQHLFNWTRTSFSANYYEKYSHPDMLDQSSCLRGNIPCIKIEGVPLMKPFMRDKKSMNLRGKSEGTSKRRKTRKKKGLVNSTEIFSASDKGSSKTGRSTETPYNETYPLTNMELPDGLDGRQIGKLHVYNKEIGKGSNGTVVFEGSYDGRDVAVKRLLRSHNDIALKEIQNLIASDRDPNIVRLYGCERDNDFVYISLERCRCSLADLIQQHSNPSFSNVEGIDVDLWRQDGLPSAQLLNLMRDVVAGIVHLHSLGIIHRDLKPHNVLISKEGPMRAKLSDMGISKLLQEAMTSESHHGTGFGSSGWQAPEQLHHGHQTRAIDLFSLGCLIFYCITKGKHPFGEYYERDMNIINNHFDLFVVDYIPEAVHLISQLLQPTPEMRPTAVYVKHHPLFWTPELRLSFLRDTSDRIEKTSETDLINALESTGHEAFGGKWLKKLDAALVADMGRYRKYNFESTRDLLRLIRNKSGHYRELTADLKELLGSLPEGFDRYFSSRFPKLMIEVYKVMAVHCKVEEAFSKYFIGSSV